MAEYWLSLLRTKLWMESTPIHTWIMGCGSPLLGFCAPVPQYFLPSHKSDMTLYSLYLRVLKSQFVVLRSNHWHFQFRLLKLGSWQNHDKPRQRRAKRLHNSCRFRINCGRPLSGVWAKCEVNERTRTKGRMTFFHCPSILRRVSPFPA